MTSPPELGEVADVVLEHATSRPPTLGNGRLICVDGPAGSGKTTLAGEIARRTHACVVHMDDLYDGWTGLRALHVQLASILGPLAQGSHGTYRRYDWARGQYADAVDVTPGAWLILEGVGSGSRAHAELCTTQVFIEAPPDVRLARGLRRDGAEAREHWIRWMVEEAALFETEKTAQRADVLVDGTGRRAPQLIQR